MVEFSSEASGRLGSLFTFNCAGAFVHHQINAPKLSPLIGNLFVSWRQYLRFLSDLPAYVAAAPRFSPPLLPRYAGSNRADCPVSHHGDVEVHWIHSGAPEDVAPRYLARRDRIDWSNVVVSFCEANFGEQRLTDDEWSEFTRAWNALPYRKVFLGTDAYGDCDGRIFMGRWRGFKHYEQLCGVDGPACKSNCPGCRRPTWGSFTHEGTWIVRALGLEDQVAPAYPFGKRAIAV